VKTVKPKNPKEKWFWPLVASSGVLFIGSVVLFVQAAKYEDFSLEAIDNQQRKDDCAFKANILSTCGIAALSGSVGSGLYTLKIKYEPEVAPLSQTLPAGHWHLLACRTFAF
jgi:hypothetical protein